MAKNSPSIDDSELDAEFDWLMRTIQREIERAIQEGFAQGVDPHVAYSISIERSVPRRKKTLKAEKQDVFWEVVEQNDSVILLVQFNFDPLDVSLSFDRIRGELRIVIQTAEKKQTRKIPFAYSVLFDKKQVRCKNGIIEVTFPKRK